MAISNKQRGTLFEQFIKEILINSGFEPVVPDGKIVYSGSPGLMLHGLAQPHNTDVLVNPPFQIPFYFPSRLIVECKCYKKAVGLPVIRNALGLREDVNSFDIVTEEILEKRRNYRRHGLAIADIERYFFQVAVASLSGFTKPAQEFALVHRIPLIDIKRMPFAKKLREALQIDDNESDEDQLEETSDIVSDNAEPMIDIEWENLKDKFEDTFNNFCVAILSSGDILFIYTVQGGKWFFGEVEEVEIHWTTEKKLWLIKPYQKSGNFQSWFELPDVLFEQWAMKGYSKEAALDTKERYFQYIYVMGKDERNKVHLKILKLSKQFIEEARERLNKETYS